jgi:hypothetical protein
MWWFVYCVVMVIMVVVMNSFIIFSICDCVRLIIGAAICIKVSVAV